MFKRIVYTGMAFALLSCHTDDESCCGGTERLGCLIEASIEGSIKDLFDSGNRIGLFPVEYVDGTPGTLGDVRNALNVPYQFDGEFWSAAGIDDLVLEANMTDIYAYYPYDPEIPNVAGKTNLRTYPFDLSGDQSARETDFLWAKATGITNDENAARLLFGHVFCRFIINLNYTNTNPAIASLVVHNMRPVVSIDLSNGAVTRREGREEILPVLLENTSPDFDLSYSAIVPPGTVAGNTPLFTMDNGDDTALFYLSSEVEFRAGYTYTFNIIIGTLETEPLNPPIITGF